MEDPEVVIIIAGDDYEFLKPEFKKFRDEHKFVSISSNPDRHIWLLPDDQTLTCEYFHDGDGKLYRVTTNWKGKNLTPILKRLLHLLLNKPVSNKGGIENGK